MQLCGCYRPMLIAVRGIQPGKRDPVQPLCGRCSGVGVRLQVSGPHEILQATVERAGSVDPRASAAATASTLRLAEVPPAALSSPSTAAWSWGPRHLPNILAPGPLCALLSRPRSGAGPVAPSTLPPPSHEAARSLFA